MTPFLVAATFAAAMVAAEPEGLRLEDPALRQFEDGPAYLQSYRPGEQVFFDVRNSRHYQCSNKRQYPN